MKWSKCINEISQSNLNVDLIKQLTDESKFNKKRTSLNHAQKSPNVGHRSRIKVNRCSFFRKCFNKSVNIELGINLSKNSPDAMLHIFPYFDSCKVTLKIILFKNRPTFGVKLEQCPLLDDIPLVVVMCCTIVEDRLEGT